MQRIPLSKGLFAIVDDEDYEELSRYNWHASQSYTSGPYARRQISVGNGNQRGIFMHRQIMGVTGKVCIDHKNHDTLDNRKANLRIATKQQNCQNRIVGKNNTSGYRGVNALKNKWQARIHVKGKRIFVGSFDTPEDAARAVDEAAIKHHGEFAWTNFPANNS